MFSGKLGIRYTYPKGMADHLLSLEQTSVE